MVERRMKPILFNTDMVRAILDGRKTVTRRVVRSEQVDDVLHSRARMENKDIPDEKFIRCLCIAPCETGDILYVRETWQFLPCIDCPKLSDGCNREPTQYEDREMVSEGCYIYKEDVLDPSRVSWRPSIHMPREVARLFLRVTDVRVERLQEIDGHGILAEGIDNGSSNPAMGKRWENMQRMAFQRLWNSTIKPSNRALYGWEGNPWVWVIEFEQISKEETG